MPPDGFCCIQIFVKISISARAPPRTLLGELTTLPQTPYIVGWGGGRRIPPPYFSPT